MMSSVAQPHASARGDGFSGSFSLLKMTVAFLMELTEQKEVLHLLYYMQQQVVASKRLFPGDFVT